MCYSGITCVTPELHAQLSPKMSREKKQSLAGLHTSCDNNIIIMLVLI